MISTLLTIAVAILAFMAGSYEFVNSHFGCNSKFSRLIEVWQGVDTYLQKVDQALCSHQCPCLISNYSIFISNSSVAPYYNLWTKANNFGSLAFQDCSAIVKSNVYTQAAIDNPLFDPKNNFNTELFVKYMKKIENNFKCTGWCNVTYENSHFGETIMYKYLFSDINRYKKINKYLSLQFF